MVFDHKKYKKPNIKFRSMMIFCRSIELKCSLLDLLLV